MNSSERMASVLGDLIATHESRPGQVPWQTPLVQNGRAGSTTKLAEPRSLFGEILDFMLAPLLLLWPLTIVITLVIARSLADAPYDQALHDRTLMLSQQVQFTHTVDGVRAHVPTATHDLLARGTDDLQYQVIGSRGQLIFGSADLPQPSLYDYPVLGQVTFRTIAMTDSDIRVAYAYVPVKGYEDLRKPILVQIGESLEGRNQLANKIIKGVIFPQFIILPIAAALVWFGLSRGLRPLRGLRDRIRDRRPDDLSPIDPQSAPHEISPLVEAFNELLGQVDNNLTNQRRFIADAAHQIKTPLAGIRIQAELALRENDPVERRRSLIQLARSSERASHLINQLLALARAENLGETTRMEQLDLNEVARDVIADLAPMALDAKLDMGFEGTSTPAHIQGNAILLGELIQNLATNAIRYTPATGLINVRVRTAMGVITLEIEDSGPGIPNSEREVVFERFFRLRDRPATNEGEARGSGLGLAIVSEIARLHKVEVVIRDGIEWPASKGRGCGTSFVVKFQVDQAVRT